MSLYLLSFYAILARIKRINTMNLFILIPLHPLFWCTLALTTGILWSCSEMLLIAAGIPLTLICVSIIAKKPRLAVAIGLSFLLGACRSFLCCKHFKTTSELLTRAPFQAVGTVFSVESQGGRFATALVVSLHSIVQEGKKISCKAKIKISLLKEPPVQVGDVLLIERLVCTPSDKAKALFKDGLSCSLYLPFLQSILLSRPPISFTRWRSKKRKQIVQALSKKLSPLSFAFMSAMMLGSKPEGELYKTIVKHCSYWGIVHYLARSGIHVVLTVSCWELVLRFIPLHFFIKQLILIFLILILHLFTWPSISFMRAVTTFMLSKGCTLSSLAFQPIHILSLTTFLTLVVYPLYLFSLDFQLSFGLTFVLAWLYEVRLQIQELQ